MEEELLSRYEMIADALAAHGIAVADNFLSYVEVENIITTDEFSQALLRFSKAGIGKLSAKQINEGIRGDYIQWVDKATAPESVKIYLERLHQLKVFLNEALFLSLKDLEVHMTVYPIGTFYKRHLDQFKKDDHRKLSVICYLNSGWKKEDGGQLRVYSSTGEEDYFPEAGRLICFRSDLLEHEVLPAFRERLSLTGWLLDREIDLKHL